MKENKFKSSFGFLMAAIGSAVGIGNLWGFPYKMGENGGFAFLLCYIAIVALVGFVVMTGEITIGRRGGKGALLSYRATGRNNAWIGYCGAITTLLLGGFCCTLTAYCLRYALANLGTLFKASWGINGMDAMLYWDQFLEHGATAAVLTVLIALFCGFIVSKGVTNGIEKFCSVGMPMLFVMLIIITIRSVTLPGATEGLVYIFKPDWSVFEGSGWISVFARAGGQAFFSLSLGQVVLITYGSYLDKHTSIEKSAFAICAADSLVALLAGCAIFPAVFAFGQEPAGGTALLFGTMQSVFNSMGIMGAVFGTLFYLLAVLAEVTSVISLIETPVAFLTDAFEIKGKEVSRKKLIIAIVIVHSITGAIVAFDALGTGGLIQPFGFTWLDFFDLFAEGFLMPIGAFAMTILLGWKLPRTWMEEEITLNGVKWKTQKFTMFCMRYVAPLLMLFILAGQLDSFFNLGWFN